MQKNVLTEEQVKAAESMLAKGYSVELKPLKDGIRVIKVIRKTVTTA